ncbi:leucine-rich repeat domain-containing protein [uncultured Polaribacter sp.]|uniref:leucine-rich repeat domain-containing protein n=1 Tax=uncultured Polaribacter sp. TaxID=174711 RepID=UPI002636F98A|nr:leucine-rich repeat domain-containing protein [uncultured Polaribacter sp.]
MKTKTLIKQSILWLLLLISTIGFSQTFTDNGYNFNVLSTNPNEVELTGGGSANAIPSSATDSNGIVYTVTTIGNSAYRNRASSVTLPNTITTIKFRAFRDNNPLTSITLPASVATIEGEAFFEGGLNEIIALGSVPASISASSFGTRSNIDLTIPSGTENIYNENGWTGFKTINGETPIGGTFTNNGFTYRIASKNPNTVSLVNANNAAGSVTIPEIINFESKNFTVTAIGGNAFRDDPITALMLPNTIKVIGSSAIRSTNLTSLVLPNSVTTIENSGISVNQNLTNITIGTGLETVDSNGFRGNGSLTTVTSNAINAPSLGSRVFNESPGQKSLVIPNGSEASYAAAGWNNNFLTINGVARIGGQFNSEGFTYRVTATNPNEVSLINGNDASGDIRIPTTVTQNSISFNVTAIGISAFRDDAITSVIIPANIINIGNDAFLNTSELTSVISNATTAPSLGSNVFRETPSIKALTIPNGSQTSYEAAGWNANFLSVNGVFRIGGQFNFEGFTYRVTSANPNEVSLINGNNASDDITIPTTVTQNSISFNVTTIGQDAFRDDAITSVVIPANIISIGNNAFRNTSELSSVISNATTAPSLGSSVFRETTSNKALTIPDGSQTSYEAARWNTNFFTINSVVRIGVQFNSEGFTYRVISETPNDVSLISGNNASGGITIPDTVNANNFTFNVIVIGQNAFRDDNITNVVIGANVQEIGNEAFRNTSELTSVISNATTAPSLGSNVFLETSSSKALTIPNGSQTSYEAAGWNTNFLSINGDVSIGAQFISGGFTYRVASETPNDVSLINGNNASGDITIPDTVTANNFTFNVTVIGQDAFRNDSLTSVTIGANVQEIGILAFQNNPDLLTVISNNSQAPTLLRDIFSQTASNKALIIPEGSGPSYQEAGWNAFFSSINGVALDNEITVDGLTYEIFSTSPREVILTGGTPSSSDLLIPASVSDGINNFNVVAIANSAFESAGLTSVTFPNTLRQLGSVAFRFNFITEVVIPEGVTRIPQRCFSSNDLTSITLPNSLESIDFRSFERNNLTEITIPPKVTQIAQLAFDFNNLTTITSLNTSAPSVVVGTNDDSFIREDRIDLFIPTGSTQSYENAGWVGFNSITEIVTGVVLTPKVFLQGASINPKTGEEDLMRDDLRQANLIPTNSPYGDGAIVSPVVFSVTGNDAIVDWVFVELRDKNNISNIIKTAPAFLQRDGDVVALDGVSNLSINIDADNYFVAIGHRNHIAIVTDTAVSLSTNQTIVDFTNNVSFIRGGSLAVSEVFTGLLSMIAGDSDGNGSVQTVDINPIVTSIGNLGYNNNDINLNGAVQTTDTPTARSLIGKLKQF